MRMYSPAQLGEFYLCRAANCPNERARTADLCTLCAAKTKRGWVVLMHDIEQPDPIDHDTHLKCGNCNEYKPDAAFSRKNAHQAKWRRYRNSECQACSAARRRHKRREAREALGITRCIALTATGARCSLWTEPHGTHCPVHARSHA